MQIIEYAYGASKPDLPGLCTALGFFDGVHLGHRRIISAAVKEAAELGLSSAVFTFPSETEELKRGSGRLYSTNDKLSIFEELGVEYAVVCDFSSVRYVPAEIFVKDVLLGQLNSERLYFGYNYRFGRGAEGTAEMLTSLAPEGACRVFEEMRVMGEPISTTGIKELLRRGELKRAGELLGEEYFVRGTVERGLGIGKKSGFPTVNNSLPLGCPLPFGVYKTSVRIGEDLYTGLTNVGECPTFGKREPHIETKILGFDRDLYGQTVKTSFIRYLRGERVFSSAEELRAQIALDECEALKENN